MWENDDFSVIPFTSVAVERRSMPLNLFPEKLKLIFTQDNSVTTRITI